MTTREDSIAAKLALGGYTGRQILNDITVHRVAMGIVADLIVQDLGGVIDVLYYSPYTLTKETIDNALTEIGTSDPAVLLLRTGTWVMDANADYSAYSNVRFKIMPGAVISHGAYTLVLPNTPDAGRYQIFSGTGAVTGMTEIFPEWFGAKGDSSTDDYTAFSLCVSSLPDTQTGFARGTILLADNTGYIIGTTLTLPNNISMMGKGWGSIIYSNVATGACIKRTHTTWAGETARRDGFLKDFTIQWNTASAAGGLLVDSGGHLEDENVQITGFTGSSMYGRSFGTGPVIEYQSRRVYCEGNYYGTLIPPTASITTANFHGDSHRGSTRQGFYINGTPFTGLTFSGRSVFESNGAAGFQFDAGTANAVGLDLGDSYFEGNNADIAGKQCSIVASGSFYIYNVTMKNATFNTPGAAATGSLEYNYIRNLLMENVDFPAVVAPNYDIWDLGGNIGQTWIACDTGATVSGIVSPKTMLVEAPFPTLRTRNQTDSGLGLWDATDTVLKSVLDDNVATFYAAVGNLLGNLVFYSDFAQAWANVFINWDGSTANYDVMSIGNKATIVTTTPSSTNITDGYLGIGIFKSGSSLNIIAMNRGSGTKTTGMKFSGTITT